MTPPSPPPPYRRDSVTWVAFGCLFGFGLLNALLGPALPYLRASEDISYLVASLHQVAFALGGGVAGLLAQRALARTGRPAVIVVGLVVAAVAALGIGYGSAAAVTVAAAFVVSLAGTAALIRLWALLSDVHGSRRAVALSEGEVCVSLAGMATPLLVGGLAATALTWRAAFVVTAVAVVASACAVPFVRLPASAVPAEAPPRQADTWRQATLVVVLCVVALEFVLAFWLASYLDDDLRLPRDVAVAMVSLLYASALAGRLLVSRLARNRRPETLLRGALMLTLVGAPILLAAGGAGWAAVGVVVLGTGIGATFPLVSSLHLQASPLGSDRAMGQVLAVASVGQIVGPLAAGVAAQLTDLRLGLLVLPVLSVAALAGLARA